MTYDLIIIGGGPAGAAAAVYAARKNLKTAIITKEFGGQSVVSETIYNWIGTKAISGKQLAEDLEAHVRDYEGEYLTIVDGAFVTAVEKTDSGFVVRDDHNGEHLTKTVLATAGSSRRKLDIPGADTFENKGVVYCASCDGPLFSGQNVAVVGGGNAGFETAAQLAAYCKSVTLIHHGADFKADEITVKKVLEKDNVTALANTEPIEIRGENFVSGMTIKDLESGERKELNITGVFVEIGQIPNTNFINSLADLDQYGRLVVDPTNQRTSIEGLWAAGDITNGLFHQNNIAAGDAVKALEDIYLYLHAGK